MSPFCVLAFVTVWVTVVIPSSEGVGCLEPLYKHSSLLGALMIIVDDNEKKNEVNHHPKFQNNVNITKARLKQHRMISQEPVKLSFCKK